MIDKSPIDLISEEEMTKEAFAVIDQRIHVEVFNFPLLSQEEMKFRAECVWFGVCENSNPGSKGSPGNYEFSGGRVDGQNLLSFRARILRDFDEEPPLIGKHYKQHPEEIEFFQIFPRFSKNFAAAWHMVETLRNKHDLRVSLIAHRSFHCSIDSDIHRKISVMTWANTAPLCICKAALEVAKQIMDGKEGCE